MLVHKRTFFITTESHQNAISFWGQSLGSMVQKPLQWSLSAPARPGGESSLTHEINN